MRLILFATVVAFVCQMLASMAGADATPAPMIKEPTPSRTIATAAPQSESPVVILAVVVEADGTISNATIAQGTGVAAIDWAALQKARQMHVTPATVNGRPVRAQTKIAVRVPSPSAQTPGPKGTRPSLKAVPVVLI